MFQTIAIFTGMKIMHEQLNLKGKDAITIKWDEFPHFTFPWHFHPEFELVYIMKSFGKRFVADHVEDFNEGDLVLLGSNLPHFWKNDEIFFSNDPRYMVNAIVIHFSPDFFSHQIENYPEFYPIRKLLNLTSRGISFSHQVSEEMKPRLKKLLKLKGLERTLFFLKILDKLSRTGDFKLLASETFRSNLYDWSGSRLDKVMHLINSNYRETIKLETVADHIGMNPSAFSRYFREKTGKPFTAFVLEMRIGYACKLLIEGNHSVSQICFESGFNNLSNFNRCFKKLTSLNPVLYRDQFYKANMKLLTRNGKIGEAGIQSSFETRTT
ncbi:MAG: AraC family transcriptional regulator [Prolixibacteraceae bacterium]